MTDFTCDHTRAIRERLTAHAPTAAEAADFWAGVPIEQEWPGRREGCMHQVCSCALGAQPPCPIQQPVEDAAGGPRGRTGIETSTDTRLPQKSVRSTQKPRVWFHDMWRKWYITRFCCNLAVDYPFETLPEAYEAALAHVAEHHTKPLLEAMEAAELAQKPAEDAFWERHYADAEADEHAEPVGNPDKHRTITVTPDQLEAVTRIFDAFGVEYTADDETPLQRAHRANGPRA